LRKRTLETCLYAIIFIAAAALRFYRLGSSPLLESEAAAAINAFHVSQGTPILFDSHSGYTLLTSVLFYLLHASEFAARFLPALIGSCLVFAPLLYKRYLGSMPGLILAVSLAIDPSLVFTSRLAGEQIFGITFLLFAVGFYLCGNAPLAGIFSALALLGGDTTWFALIILVLIVAVHVVPGRSRGQQDVANDDSVEPVKSQYSWKVFLIWFGIATFLIFSLFLLTPGGLSGAFSGLTGFISGWTQPSGIGIRSMLAGMVSYEGLPLVLGLVGAVVALIKRDRINTVLLVWLLLSGLMVFLYPARQFTFLPWFSIPLWILFIKNLLADYSLADVEIIPYFGLLIAMLAAFIFAWFNFRGVFTGAAADTIATQLRIASSLGSFLVIIIMAGIVVWGWSWPTAQKALIAWAVIWLLGFNISAVWNLVSAQNNLKQEIWLSDAFMDEDLFNKTISDYQRWNIGSGNINKIMLVGMQPDVLEWALRSKENIERVQALPENMDPEMVVSSSSQQLLLENQYAGQDFILFRQPVWEELDMWGWFRWFIQRRAPSVDETIILWVRSNQFPGYEANDIQPTNP